MPIAIGLVLASVGEVQSQTNGLAIYDDGLVNGFNDWSWASRNLLNLSPVHSGVVSISVTAKGWEALWFHHAEMSTADYSSLSLWANGGEHGLQVLEIRSALGGKVQTGGYALSVLPPNQWKQYTIPLAKLGVADVTNFTGFQFVLRAGVTDTFYVDDIQLDAKTPPAAAAAKPKSVPPLAVASAAQPIQPMPVPAVAKMTTPVPAVQTTEQAIWWIAGSLLVIITLLACLVLLFWRKNPASMAMVKAPGEAGSEPSSAEEWRQRAITAEAMAGKQGEMLREKIMPELTEFAKQSLVQGLYTQRNSLLETQQKAQLALADLESRLAFLQLPLQERIRAYEKRIAELEKEVETQGEEMRELTRATLMLVRRKLEDERATERTQGRFN